jgi:hypothetical protein
MATPTTLPGSFSAGAVLTASQMNNMRGAFRILQVVTGVATTATASSSGTIIDSGVTATITPTSSSSKILVYVTQSTYTFGAGTSGVMYLYRGATALQQFSDIGYCPGSNLLSNWTTATLDSPATTSAVTYKTAQARGLGGGTFYTQVNSNPGTIVLMEVSA